jgi:hypothetical protein
MRILSDTTTLLAKISVAYQVKRVLNRYILRILNGDFNMGLTVNKKKLLCIIAIVISLLVSFQNCGDVKFSKDDVDTKVTGPLATCELDTIVDLQTSQTIFTSSPGNVEFYIQSTIPLGDLAKYLITVDFDINDSNTTPEINNQLASLYPTIARIYTAPSNALTTYTALVSFKKVDSDCNKSFITTIAFDLRSTNTNPNCSELTLADGVVALQNNERMPIAYTFTHPVSQQLSCGHGYLACENGRYVGETFHNYYIQGNSAIDLFLQPRNCAH